MPLSTSAQPSSTANGTTPSCLVHNATVIFLQTLTLGVNYAGNESHFIVNAGTTGGNARGKWSNQVDPKYIAVLGSVAGYNLTGTSQLPLLDAPATAQNVAILTSYFGDVYTPPSYIAAGTVNSSATIGHMLTPFPQYSGIGDTWGNVGNFSYNSLQVVLNQRMHNGLTFNVNYTYSKNIGDDGTFRSGYDIPANAISGGTRSYKADRIDRSLTAIDAPHLIHAYGVYQLPFGKGKIGANSDLVNWLAGGWQFSGIYTYSSGSPLAVTWSGATGTTLVGQGQAMPDMTASFAGSTYRQNGKYGSGPNGYNTCNLGIDALGQTGCAKIQYLNVGGFSTPTNTSTLSGQQQYLIGNAPRNFAYGTRNPYSWNVDSGMRRTFPIKEGVNFVFEADCLNVWNHVTFGSPSGTWSSGSSTFGTITGASGNRDWQFAGHINF